MAILRLGRDQEVQHKEIIILTVSIHITRLYIVKSRAGSAHSKLVRLMVIEITQAFQMKFLISRQLQIRKFNHLRRIVLQHNG